MVSQKGVLLRFLYEDGYCLVAMPKEEGYRMHDYRIHHFVVRGLESADDMPLSPQHQKLAGERGRELFCSAGGNSYYFHFDGRWLPVFNGNEIAVIAYRDELIGCYRVVALINYSNGYRLLVSEDDLLGGVDQSLRSALRLSLVGIGLAMLPLALVRCLMASAHRPAARDIVGRFEQLTAGLNRSLLDDGKRPEVTASRRTRIPPPV